MDVGSARRYHLTIPIPIYCFVCRRVCRSTILQKYFIFISIRYDMKEMLNYLSSIINQMNQFHLLRLFVKKDDKSYRQKWQLFLHANCRRWRKLACRFVTKFLNFQCQIRTLDQLFCSCHVPCFAHGNYTYIVSTEQCRPLYARRHLVSKSMPDEKKSYAKCTKGCIVRECRLILLGQNATNPLDVPTH